ncbi:MAG: hypothetical protein PHI53_02900 [Candidatus Pacebacteria bacterium]|nr:hypothetical protein [Candidatus Paceibacterota bacterium]
MRIFLSENKGFTFIELIITIFVLIVGILAAFIIAQSPLSYLNISLSRLTASYLAQEGIELVRNIRDGNWIGGVAWNNGLNSCKSTSHFCEIDYNDLNLNSISKIQPPNFLNRESLGFYGYASGAPTTFTRQITIDEIDNPDKNNGGSNKILEVTVLIKWKEKNKDYDFSVQEHLYPYWPQN